MGIERYRKVGMLVQDLVYVRNIRHDCYPGKFKNVLHSTVAELLGKCAFPRKLEYYC